MDHKTELAFALERVNLQRRHVLERSNQLDEEAALLRKQIQALERASSLAAKSSVGQVAERQPAPAPAQHEKRVLRRGDLKASTGLSLASIYRMISEGRFPRSIPLGSKAVGWLKTDVDAWLHNRSDR